MKTLLSKTLSQFVLCTVVILLLTAPLFYLLTKHFYAEEMIDIMEAIKQNKDIPPLDLENDIIAGMMIQFLLIFIVLSLALLITMRFITHRLWLPFDDTLAKVEKFNLTQSEIPKFCDTKTIEFLRLNHSLSHMMQKDKTAYLIQKEFTENASHELQTPIAIMLSKLDLLMQEEMNERQMTLVADLYQLSNRMSHLNRNLLLLAKIENAQYADMENIDIAEMLSVSLPMYSALQNSVSLNIEDQRSKHCKQLLANPILTECLLKNLIVNAIRHSKTDGEVRIRLENNSLTVSNSSEGRGALNADILFQRFRSGDAKNKGNGLGLAIVKAICDFHHWTVRYDFEEERHRFIVSYSMAQ